jgi:hypothetical protein
MQFEYETKRMSQNECYLSSLGSGATSPKLCVLIEDCLV